MPNTEAYTSDTLNVKYFISKDSLTHQSLMFYDDGKDPLSIEKGNYEVLTFKGYGYGKSQIIETSSSRPGHNRTLFYELYNVNKPSKIYTSDGTKIKIKRNIYKLRNNNIAVYNSETHLLKIHLNDEGKPSKIYLLDL